MTGRGYESSGRSVSDLAPPPSGPAPGAKPVGSDASEADVRAWLRHEMQALLYTELGTPLDAFDGRPWVRTHEEEHPTFLWGTGYPEGCGHPLCGNRPQNLTGILNHPGVTMQRYAEEVTPRRPLADRLLDRLADVIFCTSCLRLRFGVGHLLVCPDRRRKVMKRHGR